MESKINNEFDAFIDDCLLGDDPLCKYEPEVLDSAISLLHKGVWQVKSDDSYLNIEVKEQYLRKGYINEDEKISPYEKNH